MINLNLLYNCYKYVRKAISRIVGNHCIYSYYNNNNNSCWSKSKGLTTSTPCTSSRSQRTTPLTTNSRSVHIKQALQQHHNRKFINISNLVSIDISPRTHTYLDSLIFTYRLHIQPPPTTLAVFISFMNFNQLLILTITFCKIIIVCNFSKERTAPWVWHHGAETCSSIPYNIRTL